MKKNKLIFIFLLLTFLIVFSFVNNDLSENEQIINNETRRIYSVSFLKKIYLCSFNLSGNFQFCIEYENLPENIKKCILYDSPIVFENHTSYKLCNNGVLNMAEMTIINNTKLYNKIKIIGINMYTDNSTVNILNFQIVKLLYLFGREPSYETVYQENLNTCGYFSLLSLFINYNDTVSANLVRKIIGKNIYKMGVSFGEMENVLNYTEYKYNRIEIGNTPNITKILCNYSKKYVPIILMKYEINGRSLHTRTFLGCYDKYIFISDTDNLYGFSTMGKVIYSDEFFRKMLPNAVHILLVTKRNSPSI